MKAVVKNRLRKCVVVAVGLIGLSVVCWYPARVIFAFSLWLITEPGKIEKRSRQILYTVNKKELYDSCIQVLDDPDIYQRDHSWSDPSNYIEPSDPNLPAPISSLSPSYIAVNEKYLRIELGGGFHHYGFQVFVADKSINQIEFVPAKPTHMYLGLWYYNEN